jgi:hypothetical protein
MAAALPPIGVALWLISAACRVVVNSSHGHQKAEPARFRAMTSRYDADAFETEYHRQLAAVDVGLHSSSESAGTKSR